MISRQKSNCFNIIMYAILLYVALQMVFTCLVEKINVPLQNYWLASYVLELKFK